MNRRSLKKITAALLFLGVAFVADSAVVAQQVSDIDAVKAANQAFYTALSARDISAMQKVWSNDVDIQNIGPDSKAAIIGWDDIKKGFEETFGNLSELKVSMEQPRIKTNGSIAWVSDIEQAQGKASGVTYSSTNLATNIFEKKSGGWVIVYHHASRTPQ
jgi:ketosteroid isomerase-like protein